MRLITLFLLTGVILLAGCNGRPHSPSDPYQPLLHLHNLWHEFLPNGTIVVYVSVVNTHATNKIQGLDMGADLTLWYPDSNESKWNIGYGMPWIVESWPPGLIREFGFVMEPEPGNLIAERNPYYLYSIDATSSGDGDDADYQSGCLRPDGNDIIKPPRSGTCSEYYRVPGAPIINWTADEDVYPVPTDPQYKALVANCCGIRSLPDYDGNSTFRVPLTGQLAANRSFPVQEGAVDGTVVVSVDTASPAGVVPTGVVRIHVIDAMGNEVGTGAVTPATSPATIAFDAVAKGIWQAIADVSGLPTATLRIDVHVNDAVPEKR